MNKSYKISIIIPVYNRWDKMENVLSAIHNSDYENYEIIVVDDGSSELISPAKRDKVSIIKLQYNQGPSAARNAGASKADGEIFLFIDSDVLIKKNTLEYVNHVFTTSNVDCLVGLYTHECPNKNLLSKFKNLFIRYSFLKLSEDVSCLHSSITAIRKEVFWAGGGFNKNILKPAVEDIIYGQTLKNMGYKIVFDRDLEVSHDKKYDLKEFIVNDFRKGSEYVKAVFDYGWIFKVTKEKQHPNTNRNFIFSIPLLYFFLLCLTLFLFLNSNIFLIFSILGIILFFVSQVNFFGYLITSEGISFSLKCLPLFVINNFVFGLAIINGIFLHFCQTNLSYGKSNN